MKEVVRITINGEEYEAFVKPNTTLVDFMRNEVGLTGTKKGCDEGECGACTVLLDGKAVNSCLVLALEANGKEVLTIEGVAGEGGELDRLQREFIDKQALQCGYCTPGMILSAKALLAENPKPTEQEVRTAIAGNLPTAPAVMGNTVLWKPASNAVFSAYYFMKLLKEAGFPDGVINFIPGSGPVVGDTALRDENLAGVHFTGSTVVFQGMWRTIGAAIETYKSYPRIVGETGGKDFLFAHPSADPAVLVTGIVRGAFEYQGQKCSAVSRAYIPKSLWKPVKEQVGAILDEITMGDPRDFKNFINALIDEDAFDKGMRYIKMVEKTEDAEVILMAMGSVVGTIKEAIDELRTEGKKVGLVKVRFYRPFPHEDIYEAAKNAVNVY